MRRPARQYSDDTLAELPVDFSFRQEEEQLPQEESGAPLDEPSPAPLQEPEFPVEGLEEEPQDEPDYLDEIEEFLMLQMVERQAQERIDRMAEKIRIHVTADFETLDQDPVEEVKPLWEEPQDLIAPDFQLEEEPFIPHQDYRPLWLYWAIGITAVLVMLSLIYIAAT